MNPRPAVFLDRDDTLIFCNDLPPPPPPGAAGDLVDPALVRALPGVLEGCRALIDAGLQLVVITNQGAVARGATHLAGVERVNDALRKVLGMPDLPVYYCPFHPRGSVARWTREHPWRKPQAGMIQAAALELDLDLSRSFLIGDAQRDLDAAIASGLAPERCLRVGAGFVSFTQAVAGVLAMHANYRPR